MLATQSYGQGSSIATQGYGATLLDIFISFYSVDTVFSIQPDTPYGVDVVLIEGNEIAFSVSAVLSLDGLIDVFTDLWFRVNAERQRFRTTSKR
jgi:hypothetical protein